MIVLTSDHRTQSFRSSSFSPADSRTIPPCNVTFDYNLALTGLSIQRAGETLEVKYRWRCLRSVAPNYWCFSHILDSSGNIVGYLDHPVLGGDHPTSSWRPGDEAAETLVFQLQPRDLQKKETYRLRLGLFDRPSGERLPITSSDFPLKTGRQLSLRDRKHHSQPLQHDFSRRANPLAGIVLRSHRSTFTIVECRTQSHQNRL